MNEQNKLLILLNLFENKGLIFDIIANNCKYKLSNDLIFELLKNTDLNQKQEYSRGLQKDNYLHDGNLAMFCIYNNAFLNLNKEQINYIIDNSNLNFKDNLGNNVIDYLIENNSSSKLNFENKDLIKYIDLYFNNINFGIEEKTKFLFKLIRRNKSQNLMLNKECLKNLIKNIDLNYIDNAKRNIGLMIIRYNKSENLNFDKDEIKEIINYYKNNNNILYEIFQYLARYNKEQNLMFSTKELIESIKLLNLKDNEYNKFFGIILNNTDEKELIENIEDLIPLYINTSYFKEEKFVFKMKKEKQIFLEKIKEITIILTEKEKINISLKDTKREKIAINKI